MKCPKCERKIFPGEITWIIEVGNDFVGGGCQECWEDECNDSWWSMFDGPCYADESAN